MKRWRLKMTKKTFDPKPIKGEGAESEDELEE